MPQPVNKSKYRAKKGGLKAESEGSTADSHDPQYVEEQPTSPEATTITPTMKKPKHLSPQEAIDEFWAKFDSKTPGRASTILPKNRLAKKVNEKEPEGEVESENAVSSYEEASKACKEKVAKIVKECKRINQKYRDQHFDIEFDLKWRTNDCLTTLNSSTDEETNFKPGSVKRVTDIFDNPQFYCDGATPGDIRQGRDGDCWLLAALSTLGNKSGMIEKLCVARDESVGVYGFVFHRDGEWISEIVDDKLYLVKPDYDESWNERILIDEHSRIDPQEEYRKLYQSNSSALYFAHCENPNETWLPLLEKAYAKAHGDFESIEGGWTGEGLEDLTGGVTTELFTTDILDKEYFWKEELMKVNQDFLFGCSSSIFRGLHGKRRGVFEGHAYSIMKCVEIEGKRFCLVRNPWGKGEWTGPWSDGSKEWTPEWMQKLDHKFGDDGIFWMTYEDLLITFQTFDRTRLFTDEWEVTQKWTSITVPWVIEYNDTKFSFTLEKKTSVVIVLSQLDERYFCGLEGQYNFSFTFRVHRAGEEDYIVRSQSGYSMSRSATTELDLESGEYHVLIKVQAERNDKVAKVEDVLRNNVKTRREKVLRIGLAYDLAHAKGRIFETNEEKEAKKRAEKAEKDKVTKEMKEKLTKEKKKRQQIANREKRKQQAVAAKRKLKEKEKAKKQAEKKKAKTAAKAENGNLAEELKKTGDPTEATEAEKEKQTAPEAQSSETVVTDTKNDSVVKEVAEEIKANDKEASTEETKDEPASKATEKATEKVEPSTQPTKDESGAKAGESKSAAKKGDIKSVASKAEDSDESDEESEIESICSDISDISTIAAEDAVLEEKVAAEEALAQAKAKAKQEEEKEEEEDEFQKDPWNAIAVVGLRIYAKDCDVAVKVVRPRSWEDGEGKLDVDDSARDATKGVDGGKDEQLKTEEAEEEAKKNGSEGSEVLV
ncbi:hypothetical protein HYFRA_00010143 [Hymenoscyphus fraxineus]|uniref:Calpain catalytic domain-containing protein n=1 Tax=Hymenoscyphus fraxineus TaxID=746836 RepID=A0A9N9KSK0_9HELO|nr:hypothetical protein HYFRA_00010143 [Hymenoscyphus fraxineus]